MSDFIVLPIVCSLLLCLLMEVNFILFYTKGEAWTEG